MKKWLYLMILVLSLGVGTLQAAGDPVAGKNKSASCAGCHGVNGKSPVPTQPNLGGQHAKYLAKQLKDFQGETPARTNAIMKGMVAALSSTDIDDLSAYYASLPSPRGLADPERVTEGERLYRAGYAENGLAACMACHSPNGAGNPAAGFPALSGQQAAYTEKALLDFRSGKRANDKNRMMRMVAEHMSDAQIKNVAAYIQGLY